MDKRLVTFGDEEGRTPLHYTAYYKFDSILGIIVEAQTSICYQSVYGDQVSAPLCVAAEEGHTSTVIELIRLSLLPYVLLLIVTVKIYCTLQQFKEINR